MRTFTLWPSPLIFFLLEAYLAWTVTSSQDYLPSYPLAVRSPYLSTWLTGKTAHDTPSGEVTFWAGQSLTWIVMARVDETPYVLFGAPKRVKGSEKAKQMNITYTASHTIVDLSAGSTNFILDFFSPVDPGNDIRQSLPYSYLSVSVTSSSAHNISIFSAIDGTWVGSDQSRVESKHTRMGNNSIFEMSNKNAITFAEEDQMAAWGETVFATTGTSNVVASVASQDDVLSAFTKTGSLTEPDSSYKPGDLVALSQSFKRVKSAHMTFAIGHYREDAINWLGQAVHTGYFRSKYPEVNSSVSHFLADYPAALAASHNFDEMIDSGAMRVSEPYAMTVKAATRQTFGAMELTIPKTSLSTSDPWTFYKEISSDGNVCSLDSMFHLLPALKVLAPHYIERLLKPYLAYSQMGGWPHEWAVHDIGSHYPNATGHNNGDAEQMPVLASGTIITFVYAWQYLSNSTTLATTNRPLLQKYANYIYKNGLYTASQLSTVDSIPPSANQTELAVSSAVALKAFGAMFPHNENYTKQGEHFADVIYTQGKGISSANLGEPFGTRKFFTFNLASSSHPNPPSSSRYPNNWGLTFSLFPDALLHLSTFPAAASALQGDWLVTQFNQYGAPYAAGFEFMNVPFAFWAAATGGKTLVEWVTTYVSQDLTNGINDVPFPDVLDVKDGKSNGAHARGTVGGVFALMAMGLGKEGGMF